MFGAEIARGELPHDPYHVLFIGDTSDPSLREDCTSFSKMKIGELRIHCEHRGLSFVKDDNGDGAKEKLLQTLASYMEENAEAIESNRGEEIVDLLAPASPPSLSSLCVETIATSCDSIDEFNAIIDSDETGVCKQAFHDAVETSSTLPDPAQCIPVCEGEFYRIVDFWWDTLSDGGIERALGTVVGRFNTRFPLADKISIHTMIEFNGHGGEEERRWYLVLEDQIVSTSWSDHNGTHNKRMKISNEDVSMHTKWAFYTLLGELRRLGITTALEPSLMLLSSSSYSY